MGVRGLSGCSLSGLEEAGQHGDTNACGWINTLIDCKCVVIANVFHSSAHGECDSQSMAINPDVSCGVRP